MLKQRKMYSVFGSIHSIGQILFYQALKEITSNVLWAHRNTASFEIIFTLTSTKDLQEVKDEMRRQTNFYKNGLLVLTECGSQFSDAKRLYTCGLGLDVEEEDNGIL